MNRNAIGSKTAAMVILAVLALAWNLFSQSTTQNPAPRPASEILSEILANQDAAPLDMYPPGYLDELLALGGNLYPPVASSPTQARSTKSMAMTSSDDMAPNDLDDPAPSTLTPGDIANMSWLDATFTMGSPSTEAERNSDESQYRAIISYGFYMAKYEITQSEYQQVVGNNPSWFTSANGYTDDPNLPVESVTWAQANNYCYLLTQQALANGSIQSGWAYRLPTEAEWEYSCRAQTAQQIATRSTAAQPPYPVPWTNPSDGITYNHYWVGTSQSGYSPSGYVYYFNDSAPTTDPNGNLTTVGANGLRIGTKIKNAGMESAWSNPNTASDGVEFACSEITSGVASCSVSGNGYVGEHWAWCPNQYFGSDLPVYSSLGNGLLYSPSPPAYTTFSFGNAIHGGAANFNDYYEYNSAVGTIDIVNPTVPYLNKTADIGSYQPNAFGLYDMHGNVSEWCQDWYGSYPTTTTVDPQGPTSGTLRVVRGGSWADAGTLCRSAIRSGIDPSTANSHIGFRIVLAPTTPDWMAEVQTQPPPKTYGIPPTKGSGKDSLVVITHGWYSPILNPPIINPPDLTWMDTMASSISASSPYNWQVAEYRWLPNAWVKYPMNALNNATQEGVNLGNSIANQGWANVHFIAHSAGAQLIQTATEIIKAYSPSTVVQCTFLDPYVGSDFAGQNTYGRGADWSDRYAAHGEIANAVSSYTDIPLYSAYNVDVTALDPDVANSELFIGPIATGACQVFPSSHGWPIAFYQNSIANEPSDYDGFGFQLSAEAGTLQNAIAQYPVGNIAAVMILGPAPPACGPNLTTYSRALVSQIDFSAVPVASKSTTGTVIQNAGQMTLITGSPAWLSIVPTNISPVNIISFAANFTSSGTGAAGLLTVCWDANVIGTIDERMVGQGVGQYTLPFPLTESNGIHVLSFRLDPFTNVQSTVTLTNVVLSQVGVSQPFSLSVTTNTVNGLPVYQLTGQAGFDYGLQASTDLVNWTQIAVLENTNGAVAFYDQDSPNYTCRFYRALAPY